MRIRIQIRIPIQGFDDQKLKKFTAEETFFHKKLQFTYPYASIKEATGLHLSKENIYE
jgi:hypothetical protein